MLLHCLQYGCLRSPFDQNRSMYKSRPPHDFMMLDLQRESDTSGGRRLLEQLVLATGGDVVVHGVHRCQLVQLRQHRDGGALQVVQLDEVLVPPEVPAQEVGHCGLLGHSHRHKPLRERAGHPVEGVEGHVGQEQQEAHRVQEHCLSHNLGVVLGHPAHAAGAKAVAHKTRPRYLVLGDDLLERLHHLAAGGGHLGQAGIDVRDADQERRPVPAHAQQEGHAQLSARVEPVEEHHRQVSRLVGALLVHVADPVLVLVAEPKQDEDDVGHSPQAPGHQVDQQRAVEPLQRLVREGDRLGRRVVARFELHGELALKLANHPAGGAPLARSELAVGLVVHAPGQELAHVLLAHALAGRVAEPPGNELLPSVYTRMMKVVQSLHHYSK
mmetsp:Transcript_2165/g.3194  ORF Transcript_2165/g.3194 Transcript_2165/m.3194 type:complete len:384 (+) Transcript_2165:222-1373(+)